MMCAKFGTILRANNDLAMGGGGTYGSLYTQMCVFFGKSEPNYVILKSTET